MLLVLKHKTRLLGGLFVHHGALGARAVALKEKASSQ
jgi:hypothetical protein